MSVKKLSYTYNLHTGFISTPSIQFRSVSFNIFDKYLIRFVLVTSYVPRQNLHVLRMSFRWQIVGQQYEITHTVWISKRLHSIIKTNKKNLPKDIYAEVNSVFTTKEQTDKLQMETKKERPATKEKIERRENLNKESFLFFLSFFYSFFSFAVNHLSKARRIAIFFVDGWDIF